MNSPNLNERSASTQTTAKIKMFVSSESKEDSIDNSAHESLAERSNKGEEDWRRRTIIIEKKNGSYGFTLQSYGIHYKKEQEIDVITYVDFVEKSGPAAAAGMREGDVILTINGSDMQKADHQTIVNAINSCDSRMRMVVIFEDCVRKVKLHVKFINLQRKLQEKVTELDKLKIRERQILDTNWKTHSLPSQKKKNSPGDPSDNDESTDGVTPSYYRPTLSSENVTASQRPQVSFNYQYLDPRYGRCVIQPDFRTGNFVITVGSPRIRTECTHYVVKSSESNHNTDAYTNGRSQSSQKSGHRHGCTSCVAAYNNQDANSLEAYDLASPCCDPHCVPNARRKHRRKRESSKEKRKEKSFSQSDRYQKAECHSRSRKPCTTIDCPGSRYMYLNADSAQTSQCSLQSCSNTGGITGTSHRSYDNSASSYTTSLSSDTLFWENDRNAAKPSKHQHQQPHQSHYKPKSWDNLTTKVIAGYGFGYGYLNTITKHVSRSKSHGRSHTSRSTQSQHSYNSQPQRQNTVPPQHYSYYEHEHRNYFVPNKSTESLLHHRQGSDSRSCSWTDGGQGSNGQLEYYTRSSTPKSPNDSRNSGYYSHHFVYPTHSYQKKESKVSSEITRL